MIGNRLDSVVRDVDDDDASCSRCLDIDTVIANSIPNNRRTRFHCSNDALSHGSEIGYYNIGIINGFNGFLLGGALIGLELRTHAFGSRPFMLEMLE